MVIKEYLREKFITCKNKLNILAALWRITSFSSISYILQKKGLELGNSVLCSELSIRDEPFVVTLGDQILDGGQIGLAQLLADYEELDAPIIRSSYCSLCL